MRRNIWDHDTGDATAQFHGLGRDPHLLTTFTDFDPASGRFLAAAGITLGR